MYLLTITTGSVLDTNIDDTMNITFNLIAFVNISTGVLSAPVSNVILHRIGIKITFYLHMLQYL